MKAFPHIEIRATGLPGTNKKIYHRGLDLRDYFAAKAMQGMLSSLSGRSIDQSEESLEIDAELYYKIADAMMEARNARTD